MTILKLLDYRQTIQASCQKCGHTWKMGEDVKGRIKCPECDKAPWWEGITKRYWKKPLA